MAIPIPAVAKPLTIIKATPKPTTKDTSDAKKGENDFIHPNIAVSGDKIKPIV